MLGVPLEIGESSLLDSQVATYSALKQISTSQLNQEYSALSRNTKRGFVVRKAKMSFRTLKIRITPLQLSSGQPVGNPSLKEGG